MSGPGGPALPAATMEFGDPRMMSLVGALVALAPWHGHGKAWLEWCELARVGVRWSDEASLLYVSLWYLVQLRELWVLASVGQCQLYKVHSHLLLSGCEDVTKAFIIRHTLKGWKKETCKMECRHPISHSLLCRLLGSLPVVCSSSFEASLFKVSICLAFFGAVRVSELVSPPSRGKTGGLMADGVILANGAIHIRIRRSKTSIFGNGEWIPLQGVSEYLTIGTGGG